MTQPKRRDEITWVKVGNEQIVHDLQQQQLHQLNPTASFIFELCDGTMSTDRIIAEVVARFDVDEQTASRDVSRTLEQFRTLSLISAD